MARRKVPTPDSISVSSFQEFIEVIRCKLPCCHWLYRGMTSADYKLIPSLGRKDAGIEGLYREELAMLRRTFAGFSDGGGSGQSDISRLLMAQHHGAPTRLLDWTSSALVAAYFASEPVDKKNKDNDFKIVAAHVCPMGQAETHYTLNDLSGFDFYAGYVNRDKDTLPNRSDLLPLQKELDRRGVIFMQGADVSPRVAAQQGYVSIHKDLKEPLNLQEMDAVTNVTHITVSSDARDDFQEGLYQLGIRRRSIFPEVDSLFGAYEQEQAIEERLGNQCRTDDT